jgi:hypothetical protein
MATSIDKAAIQHSESLKEGSEVKTSIDQHDTRTDPGYWTSSKFLGSICAIVLLANAAFIQYSLPVSQYDSFCFIIVDCSH